MKHLRREIPVWVTHKKIYLGLEESAWGPTLRVCVHPRLWSLSVLGRERERRANICRRKLKLTIHINLWPGQIGRHHLVCPAALIRSELVRCGGHKTRICLGRKRNRYREKLSLHRMTFREERIVNFGC